MLVYLNQQQLTVNSWSKDSEKKLTIFNSDLKLLVWIWKQVSDQSTCVAPRVRLGQVGDAHIQNWISECISWFFPFDAVSASLSSVTSCFNKNVFFFTSVLTEDLPASKDGEGEGEGAAICDVSSFHCCNSFCIDESNVSILQSCWKHEQTILTMCFFFLQDVAVCLYLREFSDLSDFFLILKQPKRKCKRGIIYDKVLKLRFLALKFYFHLFHVKLGFLVIVVGYMGNKTIILWCYIHLLVKCRLFFPVPK